MTWVGTGSARSMQDNLNHGCFPKMGPLSSPRSRSRVVGLTSEQSWEADRMEVLPPWWRPDQSIGRLMEQLKKQGALENTLIMFAPTMGPARRTHPGPLPQTLDLIPTGPTMPAGRMPVIPVPL